MRQHGSEQGRKHVFPILSAHQLAVVVGHGLALLVLAERVPGRGEQFGQTQLRGNAAQLALDQQAKGRPFSCEHAIAQAQLVDDGQQRAIGVVERVRSHLEPEPDGLPLGADTSTQLGSRFENEHAAPGLRHTMGQAQPADSGPEDHDIDVFAHGALVMAHARRDCPHR